MFATKGRQAVKLGGGGRRSKSGKTTEEHDAGGGGGGAEARIAYLKPMIEGSHVNGLGLTDGSWGHSWRGDNTSLAFCFTRRQTKGFVEELVFSKHKFASDFSIWLCCLEYRSSPLPSSQPLPHPSPAATRSATLTASNSSNSPSPLMTRNQKFCLFSPL